MAFSSLSYCNTCGAANQEQAVQCFVCGVPLLAPVAHGMTSCGFGM